MSDEEAPPTPEELEVIRKYCKHRSVVADTCIELLKVGATMPGTCENCGTVFQFDVKWDRYIGDENGPVSCMFCGCFIVKGDEADPTVTDPEEWSHDRCESA